MIDPGAADRRAKLTQEELWAELDPWEQTQPLEEVEWNGGKLRVGDRVRLAPHGRADVFDITLAGKLAVVQALEQDFEDQFHVAVVLDDDPGRDLGNDRMPGHRFFFKLSEVALVRATGEDEG